MSANTRSTSKRLRSSGFTLVEILFSLGLFATLSLALTTTSAVFMRINSDNDIRSGAIQVASIVIDQLRSTNPSTLPTVGAQELRDVTISGRPSPFNVTITYCARPELCTGVESRHLRVRVAYKGRDRFSTDTVITQLR